MFSIAHQSVAWIDRLPPIAQRSAAPLLIAIVPLVLVMMLAPAWLAGPAFTVTLAALYFVGMRMTPAIFEANKMQVHTHFIMPFLFGVMTLAMVSVAYASPRMATVYIGPMAMAMLIILMPVWRKKMERTTRRVALAWVYIPFAVIAVLVNTFEG